jgi:ABC-type antimicrobial peptide transport system permease subunit
MTLRDLIELSFVNLYKTRLRTILTVAGVVIAIATFTAMVSFGAGNQKFVADTYSELGLFTTMKVYPVDKDKDDKSDTLPHPRLDKEAIKQLSTIPGVLLAYPFVDFPVTATIADTQVSADAQALSIEALRTGMYSYVLGGHTFSSDSAYEAILSHEFAKSLGYTDVDSLIGKRLIIAINTASVDSAFINIIDDKKSKIWDRWRDIDYDSLFDAGYRGRVFRQELSEAARRFIDGFFNRQLTVSDTLTVIGVGEAMKSHSREMAAILIPEDIARHLTTSGLGIGNDPLSLVDALRSGDIFATGDTGDKINYPRVTLDLDPYQSYKGIKDSVEALGFKAFSYAEQFEKIQRFFLYYNAALGIIGLIALLTASLGIINTMLMSIIERRKEIGILQSLGAYKRDIWIIFLTESGVIGLTGGVIGVFIGWLGTRIIYFALKLFLESQDMPGFDPFALPIWLIVLALFFGLIVSLLAGLYPAARAARVDPVEALRGE